ncbi:helix-turn-helix domain-containing protein [Streptomyces cocklensis]|jgi:predicted DNA-binding transcriptional regulator AlpA|uniref:Helix-turn-helix domain-containing protein n=1 Tax=Actinacidiphila cocklensis TaxID=887465 RepID=A0A9W4GPC8_9ACTN|nr:helix-turn-helix domain-containing protein [Actinacidiphila cocklensis]MDD1061614.1 helix-turn-helix domain-containing protein [Actinacidiphila cocklensis]CAG6392355.1 Helix-turn-helix domain-containing protein [Actinacidiphila cocklensis]
MAERRRNLAAAADASPALPARYLTPEDLVEMFELPSVETVYQWRRKRTGPRGFRVGRHLRFDPADVRAWVDCQREGVAA